MDVAKDMEIFGPVISVIGFDTIDEAVEIANQSSFGLCGCVLTKDYARPFGEWKHSGIGNEGVMTTLQEMSRIKTIVLKKYFII